jgi:hypothetical protein
MSLINAQHQKITPDFRTDMDVTIKNIQKDITTVFYMLKKRHEKYKKAKI